MQLLFVCTGNICRSPTAERLAAQFASERRLVGLRFSSAGIRAVIGHPIHPGSAAVLQVLGGDPSAFQARQLTSRLASAADLILGMTKQHREAVLEIAPQKLHRTFTLAEAAQIALLTNARTVEDLSNGRAFIPAEQVPDIMDPIGRARSVFDAVGAKIAELLPPVLDVCERSLG
ncbi:arsenate reductase/protein-tyrosine-phosphatase family protein [Mycolicibacterium psychrotolerans]|nr:low molecular weight phosphatase family protein [Mycolicibacterium psychrotolerans]